MILKELEDTEDREYETINRGRAITGKWLATRLAPFGIESDQPRRHGEIRRHAGHQKGVVPLGAPLQDHLRLEESRLERRRHDVVQNLLGARQALVINCSAGCRFRTA